MRHFISGIVVGLITGQIAFVQVLLSFQVAFGLFVVGLGALQRSALCVRLQPTKHLPLADDVAFFSEQLDDAS